MAVLLARWQAESSLFSHQLESMLLVMYISQDPHVCLSRLTERALQTAALIQAAVRSVAQEPAGV